MFEQFFNVILTSLYSVIGDLGLSIVAMTLLIRSLLLPISLPSLKAQKKIKKIQPELEKLKQKYKKNPKAMQQAQQKLYKKYNVNPLAGCLPQILKLIVLLGLYRALTSFLGNGVVNGLTINPSFLWLDLTQSDSTYVLPILVGVVQFLLALMLSPGAEVRDIVSNKAKSKKIKKENEKEENTAEMAKAMQKQMIFMMPVMTAFIATRLPAGLAVYWVTTNIYSMVQQYFISGWGGLETYSQRIISKLKK
jgi:YidC/Oxa1 family membrane protein insertase